METEKNINMFKRKSKKKKGKNILISEFDSNNYNFKNTALNIDLSQLCFESLTKINKMSKIPNKNEHIRIVTKKAINTFDFIQAILANENIKELTIAVYRIGKKIVAQLYDLHKSGKIKKITILINDGFPKLVPDCWNLIKSKESDKWIIKLENNHTKILLIDTIKNKYIVEGSGNMSINARIEQYCFDNNKHIYDFHYNWIDKI